MRAITRHTIFCTRMAAVAWAVLSLAIGLDAV